MSNKGKFISIVVLSALLVLAVVQIASAAVKVDTSALRDAVTVEGVREHQAAFQDIADAFGGTRVSGKAGYNASAAYVVENMEAAGYDVTVQEFDFPFFRVLSNQFEQTSPDPTVYQSAQEADPGDYDTMTYSGSGVVTASVEAVDLSIADPSASTSGCEADDFTGFTAGNVALIQRGFCTFALKASNAEAAGATGAIVFNQGTPGREGLFFGTLGSPGINIPVISVSFDLGQDLNDPTDTVVSLDVQTESETRTTSNVIAETPGGRDDRVVVVGAHLDSVPSGPGIQDNGSGSAAILEVAIQMANLGIEPENKVRFAWWGAEESGLLGSEYYVDNLSKRDIKNIALNLNFDMIGSPNFVRFIYDGDGSDTALAGPNGSANIERVFVDYFAEQGLATEPTEFSGRSDYGPFIAVGIPAGGLFTGAEGEKTAEQAEIFGGTAGVAYDPCYHLACDTFENISLEVLDQNSDAVAHAVLTFAQTTSAVNGTDKGNGNGHFKADMDYSGSRLVQ
jgi:Zn-dependent M28 family amino/carboxypeptidase